MNMDWDQLGAVGALAGVALIGVALIYLAVALARGVTRWVFGRGGSPEVAPEPSHRSVPLDPQVTAADLVAIRSNLLAVTRQIEDLERRLRLGAIVASKANVNPYPAPETRPASA
jgi:hypothetical protein